MTQYERIKADPVKYAKHVQRNMEWQKRNKDKAREYSRRYQRRPDVAAKRNALAKEKYHSDDFYRLRNASYQAKHRSTSNGYISGRIRAAIHLIRQDKGGGMYRRMFTAMSGKIDHYESLNAEHVDHIKPLAKFNLSDPIQLLKAVHWTNVRGCSAAENMKKGDDCEPFDMDSLEYCSSEDALYYAKYFIERCKKMNPNPGCRVKTLTRDLYEQWKRADSRGCTVGSTGTSEGRVLGAEEGSEEVAESSPGSEHSGLPEVSCSVPGEGEGVPAEMESGVEG